MLAYIHKQALDNQRLPYACLLSTKGAYYDANKQASISCIARDRRQDKRKQGKQALARDKSHFF
jgi:hypothetical protein